MKTLRIKDICDKGSSSLKQKDVENQNGVYPVFGASGLIGKIDTYHQNKDYIAIVKDGSGIGRVTFMPAFSSIIGTLQYILPKEGFNIKYISYCLQSLDLAHYKQGAAIPHIYFRDYGEYEVNVEENPDDQQRIVTYLDAEFAKIEALKANAEKQLQAAKDLFQAALKELLTPKEGWEEKKLGELCHIVGGGTPSKRESKYYGGNIPWASIRDMNFDILSETELCITNEGLKNSTSHLINKGEIVIATRVGLGKVCILAQDTAINQDIKGIIPKKENIDRLFMFYFFKKNAKFIEENGVGATVKGVKIQFIENLSFPMIKISEQQRIATHLDALSANVKALQTNYTETITLCNDLKQALLKKVFG